MAAILQICSDAGSPTAGTQALETLIESSGFAGGGHTVTLRSDEIGEDGSDETNFDVVVIDESVSSATVGTDYEDYTIGRFVLEDGIWDDYDLTDGSSVASANEDVVNVDNDTHPLCNDPNDLGTDTTALTITSANFSIRWLDDAGIAASFIPFVFRSSPRSRKVGFAFDDGATLENSNTATSRIVALGYSDSGMDILTTVGENVFENALTWLLPDDGGLLPVYRLNVYHQSRRHRESQVFA